MTNKEKLMKDENALVKAIFGQSCYRCAYLDHGCKRPKNKSCLNGIQKWLNEQYNK